MAAAASLTPSSRAIRRCPYSKLPPQDQVAFVVVEQAQCQPQSAFGDLAAASTWLGDGPWPDQRHDEQRRHIDRQRRLRGPPAASPRQDAAGAGRSPARASQHGHRSTGSGRSGARFSGSRRDASRKASCGPHRTHRPGRPAGDRAAGRRPDEPAARKSANDWATATTSPARPAPVATGCAANRPRRSRKHLGHFTTCHLPSHLPGSEFVPAQNGAAQYGAPAVNGGPNAQHSPVNGGRRAAWRRTTHRKSHFIRRASGETTRRDARQLLPEKELVDSGVFPARPKKHVQVMKRLCLPPLRLVDDLAAHHRRHGPGCP